MDLSFEEKSAWVNTVIVLLLFGYYFGEAFGAEILGPAATLGLLFRVVLAVVVIEIVVHVVMAIAHRPEGTDERDVLVSAKSARNGGMVLGVAVFGAIGYSLLGGAIHQATQVCNPDVIAKTAHILVLGAVAGELTRCASQLFYYRQGV